MKQLYLLLAVLIFQMSFAQDPELFENTWYLQNVIINGEDNFPPFNSEVESVQAHFYSVSNGDSADALTSFVCNSIYGLLLYDPTNPSFSFLYLEQTLGSCSLQLNTDFEVLYFSFYYSDQLNPFAYLIETDSNDNKTLTVTSASGNQAIYGNHLLSREDFYSSRFSMHPNPAKNKLFITTKNAPANLKIKIFNIEGKLLSTQSLALENETSIDVSHLVSGIYFLDIEDENGNTEVKKFIKE